MDKDKKIVKLQEACFNQVFQVADNCLAFKKQGLDVAGIAAVTNLTVTRVEQLVAMAQAFPPGERYYNIPIGIYEAAALFPNPVETVNRAWENHLQPDDLQNEIRSWALKFDALGYGTPPCKVPSNVPRHPRKTPIEEAIGVDEEGYTTARRLYTFLGLHPAAYARWAKMNILENPYAEEGVDFFSFNMDVERGNIGVFNPKYNPKGTKDFKLTARFAKKLAMASNSPKGEQARDYYVSVEERAKALANGQIPTGLLPSEELLGIASRFGGKLDKYTLNRLVRLALAEG